MSTTLQPTSMKKIEPYHYQQSSMAWPSPGPALPMKPSAAREGTYHQFITHHSHSAARNTWWSVFCSAVTSLIRTCFLSKKSLIHGLAGKSRLSRYYYGNQITPWVARPCLPRRASLLPRCRSRWAGELAAALPHTPSTSGELPAALPFTLKAE